MVKSQQSIAKAIIQSIAPYWYDDPHATIRRPGNWPVDAEYGVVASIHARDFYNHDCGEIKFFRNKEELDAYLEAATDSCQESDCSLSVEIYGWDWGPERLRSQVLA